MAGVGYSQQQSDPTKVDTWNPQQQELFGQLSQLLSGGASGGVQSYPGQMHVGLQPQGQAYLDSVNQGQGMRQNALTQILSGTVPYEMGNETAQQFYEQGIRDPALREHREVTVPGIKSAFSGPGYYSRARMQEQARSGENLATNLAQQKAGLMYGEEKEKRTAQEAALNRQAMYGGAAAAGEANIMGTAGGYARQIEQEKMLGQMQRWLSGETVDGVSNSAYNPYLQLMFQALGLQSSAIGQSSSGYGFSAQGGNAA